MRSKPMLVLISLVVTATVLFSGSGMAVAQDDGGTVGPQSAIPCNGSVAPSGGVLCDQMDSGSGSSTTVNSQNNQGADAQTCQVLGAPPGCMTTEAADDFVVPTSGGVAAWIIDKVEVSGYYGGSGQAISAVNIKFFANILASGQNVPGILRYQASFGVSQAGNVFTVNLDSPALLAAGQTYWMEFQVVLGGGRNWYWEERPLQTGTNPSAWQTTSYDPFSTGCTSWKPRLAAPPTGCGIGTQPDLLFRLSGRTTTTFFETFLPLVNR